MHRTHAKVCPSIKGVTFQKQDVASSCLGGMDLIHFEYTDVSVKPVPRASDKPVDCAKDEGYTASFSAHAQHATISEVKKLIF